MNHYMSNDAIKQAYTNRYVYVNIYNANSYNGCSNK